MPRGWVLMVSIRSCGVAMIGNSIARFAHSGNGIWCGVGHRRFRGRGAGAHRQPERAAEPPGRRPTQTTAYITGIRGGPIYVPGQPTLATGSGSGQTFLTRARGGYLLTVSDRIVRYVSDTGARHRVFRVPESKDRHVRDVVVSPEGRSVALTVRSNADPGYDRVVVRRIAHPKTIAQHRFSLPVVVTSLTAGRAFLTPDGLADRPNRSDIPTRWWNLHTGHLRLTTDPSTIAIAT